MKNCWSAGVVCVFVIFFGTLGGCIIFVKEKRRLGALVQGIFRGNTLLFGLPLVTTLYGDERAGVAALMIAVVIPVYNTLAVILLESCRGGRASLKKVLYGIVTNPLIVGTVTGLAGLLCGVHLPAIADEAVMSITKITTPLALLGLGGTFCFDAVGHNLRALFWAVFSRLVLTPAILMPVVIALGFREVTLAALLTIPGCADRGKFLHHGAADGFGRGTLGTDRGIHFALFNPALSLDGSF